MLLISFNDVSVIKQITPTSSDIQLIALTCHSQNIEIVLLFSNKHLFKLIKFHTMGDFAGQQFYWNNQAEVPLQQTYYEQDFQQFSNQQLGKSRTWLNNL